MTRGSRPGFNEALGVHTADFCMVRSATPQTSGLAVDEESLLLWGEAANVRERHKDAFPANGAELVLEVAGRDRESGFACWRILDKSLELRAPVHRGAKNVSIRTTRVALAL